jgi:hypothetical protein
MKDKPEIKVGSIIKKSYSAARKPTQREHKEYNYEIYLPIAGMVKKIYYSKTGKLGVGPELIADIDWFSYEVPDVKGIADPWDLDYEKKHKFQYKVSSLSLFEPYYKGFLKRSAEKKKKKESSLQARKTVVE